MGNNASDDSTGFKAWSRMLGSMWGHASRVKILPNSHGGSKGENHPQVPREQKMHRPPAAEKQARALSTPDFGVAEFARIQSTKSRRVRRVFETHHFGDTTMWLLRLEDSTHPTSVSESSKGVDTEFIDEQSPRVLQTQGVRHRSRFTLAVPPRRRQHRFTSPSATRT